MKMPDLQERAEHVASWLASLDFIDAVCLFGSVARGDATSLSDIDLLAVGGEPAVASSDARAILYSQFPWAYPHVSLFYLDAKRVARLFETGAPFAFHLQREGLITFDKNGYLKQLLGSRVDPLWGVTHHLPRYLETVSRCERWSRFTTSGGSLLSRIYGVARSVVELVLIVEGTPEFNQRKAFSAMRKRHPELTVASVDLEELFPFYEWSAGRALRPPPAWGKVGSKDVERAAAHVRECAMAIA